MRSPQSWTHCILSVCSTSAAGKMPPALGKALAYTTRQWTKLTRHLQHADIPVDNNPIERQIKHYATGRKPWLFSYDALVRRRVPICSRW